MFSRQNKGQVAPFMTIIIVVLLLVIAAVMIIGEYAFIRLRMANVADSAVINAASGMCRSLNQIRIIGKQMNLNTWTLQAVLAGGSPWATKETALLAVTLELERGLELKNNAESIASPIVKTLRAGLYDGSFGGALIDEPKPFLKSETETDDSGRITLLYDKYLTRDSHFTTEYRHLKKGESSADTGRDYAQSQYQVWWQKNALAYVFNKTKDNYTKNKGYFTDISTPDKLQKLGFESYLEAEVTATNDVSVEFASYWAPFLYCQVCPPHGCCPWLGICPVPYAYIANVDMDKDISLTLTKYFSLGNNMFFPRVVVAKHTSAAVIRGSMDIAYDFVMQQQ